MKERCCNPKSKSYKNYGLRGIDICEEWKQDFMSFYNWAIANGYSEELTIDRIDNNKGYAPDNCRWVNKYIQNNNTRRNRKIHCFGETHTVSEWAMITGINRNTINSRLNKGLSPEKILAR
jgi:Fic family protein